MLQELSTYSRYKLMSWFCASCGVHKTRHLCNTWAFLYFYTAGLYTCLYTTIRFVVFRVLVAFSPRIHKTRASYRRRVKLHLCIRSSIFTVCAHDWSSSTQNREKWIVRCTMRNQHLLKIYCKPFSRLTIYGSILSQFS